MSFRFVGQPFPGADQIGLVLASVLSNEHMDRAWFATAWGKQSGLSRLAPAIEDFRDRGGYAEAIFGVDEGGATKEGLRLALELFDSAYIFHDPGIRTFHPKVYVVQSSVIAEAVVGSGNLTQGGLFTNFEAGVAAKLNLEEAADAFFLAKVRKFYESLVALPAFCKPLTEQLIDDIEADPRLVLLTERQANRRRARQRGRGGSSVFGGQAIPDLRGAPPPGVTPPPEEEDEGDDALVIADTSEAAVGAASQAEPVAQWWKQMTASDAHRKPETSHQRNYVALSQAGHPIDHKSWFRAELFGPNVAWSDQPMRSGNSKEVAVIPFDVLVEDEYLGKYNLTVDHAENRIADQNNAPTYLNWSGLLPVIRASDFRGWWMGIARLSDGSFQLKLLSQKPSA